jgi:hypothetical protein
VGSGRGKGQHPLLCQDEHLVVLRISSEQRMLLAICGPAKP